MIKVTDSVVMQNEILNPGLPHYKLVIQNVLSGRKEYPRFSEVSGWGWGVGGAGNRGILTQRAAAAVNQATLNAPPFPPVTGPLDWVSPLFRPLPVPLPSALLLNPVPHCLPANFQQQQCLHTTGN